MTWIIRYGYDICSPGMSNKSDMVGTDGERLFSPYRPLTWAGKALFIEEKSLGSRVLT